MTTQPSPHDPSLDITEDDVPTQHDSDLDVSGSDEPHKSPTERVHPPEPVSQTNTRNQLAAAVVGVYLLGVLTWIVMGVVQGDTGEIKSALLVLASLALPVMGYYFGGGKR
jgi:uncharacterized protein HemX